MNRLLPKSAIDGLRRKKKRTQDITTSVKIPRRLDLAIKREARAQQRSQSWLIREALQSYIAFRNAKQVHSGQEDV